MFVNRVLNKQERWVSQYEGLVTYICSGYEEIIYEYTNDLSCRLFIQEGIESVDKEILKMMPRIRKADSELKQILIPCNKPIHGNYPKNYFWFWGVPQNSIELMNEARTNQWI